MLKLRGVVPALTTPFKEDRSLDLASLRRLVDILIDEGVHGLVAGGCTGESWALEDDEPHSLFKAAVEQAKGRVPIVAGCSGIAPKHVIKKARMAEAAGCDALMIQPPYYALPGEDEVFDFYKEILAATKLPVMIYNIPRRNGINMSVDLVGRLAEQPGVFAIKESSKGHCHVVERRTQKTSVPLNFKRPRPPCAMCSSSMHGRLGASMQKSDNVER